MGNEIFEDKDFQDKQPEDFCDNLFRYGIVTKKCGEKGLEDAYITYPTITSPQKKLEFSLFGIFDGHNNDYVSKYISSNIHKLYQKEIESMNDKNLTTKIEGIFKSIDKSMKEEDKNDKDNKEGDKKKYIEVGVNDKELQYFKDVIKNSKELPDEAKKVEDSELKDLILFKNLFKYNNHYLYNNNDVNYIGSSASMVFIKDDKIITADLGITACILFNNKGEIQNKKDDKFKYEDYINRHTFKCKEEKKRIKKFNKDIDINDLKINIYVPASRCFGLFKYKNDEILREENQIISCVREENQIISCVPEIKIYPRNEINYILLMTKGMLDLIGNDITNLIQKIVKLLNENKNKDFKISKFITEYIAEREKIKKEEKINEDKNKTEDTSKGNVNNIDNNIYVGKDDFSEENSIINELNSNYYRDIMNLNIKKNIKMNTTCMLIELFEYHKKEETPKDGKKDVKKNEEKKQTPMSKEGKKIEEEKNKRKQANEEGKKKKIENVDDKDNQKEKKEEDSKDKIEKEEKK